MKKILSEILIGFLFGAGIMASFLFLGLRVKAAPAESDLVTIDRRELNDIRKMSVLEPDDPCPSYSEEDLDLLAALIWAEAGDQPFYGKRLVADVVLNRVASSEWPGSIAEVIFQPGQFSVVANGRLNHAQPDADCYDAAQLALEGDRCDTQIIYFSMYYCANGTFAYQFGDHYFGY